MKTPHIVWVVVAVLAAGILIGVALYNIIFGPGTAGDHSAEGDVGAEESATDDEDEDELWSDWPDDRFGSSFAGGFEEEYVERKLLLAWVDAVFIQIATADLDDVRIGDQAAFGRGNEKLLLTADEKGALFDQLKAKPSFRIIASASVTTISGQQAVMQFTECLPYLTEPDTESAMEEIPDTGAEENYNDRAIRCWPTLELEEIEVGARLAVTPTISADGRVITLVLLPEVAQITGWADFGSGPPQPLYRTYNVTTTVYLLDGMSVLMAGVPLSQHGGAPHPNVKSPDGPPGDNTVLVLVTVRLIELPIEEEPGTDPPPTEPRPF